MIVVGSVGSAGPASESSSTSVTSSTTVSGSIVSAVALVVETETSDAVADEGPVSLDASGTADEPALDGDGVIAADPDEEALLDVPEVTGDEMPDSDLEEE